ncbi:MAG TPA: PilZ domain-containing protein [Actinomycetes bacterium]|nr:PilZ domain-containing protein [Actinomycetes bacterium]
MSGDPGADRPLAPPVGAQVVLLSQRTGLAHDATVEQWRSSPTGMDVTVQLSVAPDVAERLADQRIWVTVAGHGRRLTVLSGVARLAGPGELSMTGISPVVRERRRSASRAQIGARVRLRSTGRGERLLDAIDLSRDAVRVALVDAEVTVGEHVAVRLDLDDGDVVSSDGVVVRVEAADGYAVVRFDRLPREQAGRIDRYVLFRLARSG